MRTILLALALAVPSAGCTGCTEDNDLGPYRDPGGGGGGGLHGQGGDARRADAPQGGGDGGGGGGTDASGSLDGRLL